jgi:ApbE superfamily uncharacterized protein (UPF0280 family)
MTSFASSHAIHSSPLRHYRRQHAARQNHVSFQVVVDESDLWITAPCNMHDLAAATVRQLRGSIHAWSALHPEFAHSLTPVAPAAEAPPVIRRMIRGAQVAGVGPMAAVAGTIAQMVAETLHAELRTRNSAGTPDNHDVLVENGGDIFMISAQDRTVGLLPDPASSAVIGFAVPAEAMPLSVCSSSATIGHSLSLGHGELASVAAADAAVADAAATAFCNMLRTADDVQRVTARAETLKQHGVRAVFVQCCGKIGIWGDLELTAVA